MPAGTKTPERVAKTRQAPLARRYFVLTIEEQQTSLDSQPEDSDIPPNAEDFSHPDFLVDDLIIRRIDVAIRTYLGLADLDMSIRFATLSAIQELNRDFRAKDSPTDVLAFPQLEWRTPHQVGSSWRDNIAAQGFGDDHLGDVVICLERAAEQAEELGQDLGREVIFLLIHGTLHLCGYDHHTKEDERVMLPMQQRVLTHLRETGMQPLWQQCIRPKEAC